MLPYKLARGAVQWARAGSAAMSRGAVEAFGEVTAELAASEAAAGKAAGTPPRYIYSARELLRRAETKVKKPYLRPDPFHNFPESMNELIFTTGRRERVPNFFKKRKPNLSDDSIKYFLEDEINGVKGLYEIFTRPSISGRTEVIMHRFFNCKLPTP